MADSPEDFERLLERCRAQLNAITLTLPILEEEGGPNALPPPKAAEIPHFLSASVAVAEPTAPPKPPPEPVLPSYRPPEPERESEAEPAAPPSSRFEPDDAPPPPRDLPLSPPPASETSAEPEPPHRETTALDAREEEAPERAEPPRRSSFDLTGSARVRQAEMLEEDLPEPPPPSAPTRAEIADREWRRVRESRTDAKSRSPFGWGALGLVAVVAAGGYGLWRLQRPPADRVFNLDAGDAAALRPERSDLVVAAGAKLLEVSESGRVVDRRDLEAPATSLSWNQGALWSVDGVSRAVVERPDETKRATTFTLNYVPQAVCSRGRYVWTLEGGSTIRQYLVSRSLVGVQLQPLDLYQLSDISAGAIAVDDAEILWVFDKNTRRLSRLHKVGPVLRQIDSAPLTPWIGAAPVRALSVDDGTAWILVGADGGRAAVHRVLLSRLDWTGA